MSFPEGSLIIGDGPEVYYVQNGTRRWVPDPLTLQAVDPRSWGAVQRVPQADLLAVPAGVPLPALNDGSLSICPGGPSYFARGGQFHLVPDAETLASLPRDHVASTLTDDFVLLKAAIGDPLPSVTDTSASVAAIDAYIRSLAPLPYEPDSDTPGPLVKRPGVTEVDGVDVEVTEQRVRMSRQVSDFVEISPIPDVMYAGSAVAGVSVPGGALAPIALTRAPGQITVTTDLTLPAVRSQSKRLERPDLPSYVDALNELLDELKPTDSAAAMSYRLEKINTLEQGMVSFGLNLKGSGWNVDAKASLNGNLTHSTVFGMFSQAYYQVAFTPEGSPPQFFADDVTLDEVKAYAGPNNPPCYLSSVTYGRMVILLVDGEASSLEIKAALSGAWTAAVSGAASLSAEYKNTLARSSVTAVVIGGSSGAAGDIIEDPANNLLGWVKKQLTITADLPVTPIQYTVRYMAAPHHLVKVSRTTDPVRIVDANVYGGREAAWSGAVGEGPGCGPVGTGLRMNRGDDVTVTATGSIWAGWVFIGRNGPEGLDGPPKPWYPLPDGDGVRGSMLIGGFDNTNWFPVGGGRRFTVPAEREDGELWFRLNDDNMTNGNGRFDINVSLRRRMPVINAAG
ncbi:thiol-activated cytolysin family protein [Paractinoplanes atraurantiacus]|uniref:Thiol-activated cytolysin n=1 Tax=Paractinoplanes atraurantiacus TaxID=1036182 RepID=A0A285HTS2_9ACTN|nr:thiol-activated cytolysin family protein [Actinoplanes atraurantiacus]SNY39128.1 Thiol-activated cytolysin [Actinoplanes atraurantiacus]